MTTDVDQALRAALSDLANEARPVDLGDRALSAVRRRSALISTTAIVVVAAIVATVLIWPQWTLKRSDPAATPSPTPAPTQPPDWPLFAGLPSIPSGTPGAGVGRLVVAGYNTFPVGPGGSVDPATVATYLLDPSTGRYALADVDVVLAFSPDLHYALVGRQYHYGIYDTVAGMIVGGIDVRAGLAGPGDRFVWNGYWSPDGRSIALSVRLDTHGRGFLANRLVFIDVLTGALQAVDLPPADGYEPDDLLGFVDDSSAVAMAADQIDTDQAPRAHIVYDRQGRVVTAHQWPAQSYPVRVPHSDQLLLMPMDPGEIVVMRLDTGVIEHRYATQAISSMPSWEFPVSWREDSLIYRSQICTSDRCSYGPYMLGVTISTGQSRTLHTVPENAQYIYLAPGDAVSGAAAGLTW